jgi:modulator of FtsH protease HflC
MARAIIALLFVATGAAALLTYMSAFIVHQNEQALVLEFGNPVRVINVNGVKDDAASAAVKVDQSPGLKWKIPVVQTVEYFDKRILDLDTPQQELTASDQKRLVVDAFTRYRIVNPLKFYQTVRTEARVRDTLGQVVASSLRRVLGSVSFTDVVRDKREELMRRIARAVNDEGKDFGLEVVDVRIKRADLPEQNSKSVFDRMRAERDREAAEFRAEGAAAANKIRATADREATVIKADAISSSEQMRGEGDAERNRVFNDAYGRDPEFFAFYRSMLAYEQGFKSGDTRMLLSPDSEFFRYFQNPRGVAPSPKR